MFFLDNPTPTRPARGRCFLFVSTSFGFLLSPLQKPPGRCYLSSKNGPLCLESFELPRARPESSFFFETLLKPWVRIVRRLLLSCSLGFAEPDVPQNINSPPLSQFSLTEHAEFPQFSLCVHGPQSQSPEVPQKRPLKNPSHSFRDPRCLLPISPVGTGLLITVVSFWDPLRHFSRVTSLHQPLLFF